MKKKLRILSFVLAIVMILMSAAFTVSAVPAENITDPLLEPVIPPTEDGGDSTASIEIFTQEAVGEDILPITEIVDRREENVKHFRLPNGTIEAVVYAKPVHRMDDEGVWQDIDNNLLADNAKAPDVYATDDLRAAFTKSFQADEPLFTLNENGYLISMGLQSEPIGLSPIYPSASVNAADTAKTVSVTNAVSRADKLSWNNINQAREIDNRSSIIYTNVRPQVDIEYILEGNDVKENIIVKAPSSSYVYSFELELEGLTASLNGDGSVYLSDVESGEIKYEIPAPYMYDADGAVSYDVEYALTEQGDGIYTLTVTADGEWMNDEDRAFPVTIDPTLNVYDYVFDTYIDSNYPNTNYGSADKMVVSNTATALIFMFFPSLPVSATIHNAKLHVSYYNNSAEGSMTLGLYSANEFWNEDATYNTAPEINDIAMATADIYVYREYSQYSPLSTSFDITNRANNYYYGYTTSGGSATDLGMTEDYGYAIKRESGSVSSVNILTYDFSEDYCAYMTIVYSYDFGDGVFAIKSAASSNRWMSVENDSYEAGAKLQQEYLSSSAKPVTVFDRSCLFKISKVSGTTNRYIIRSMLNNDLTIGISNNNTIVTKEIPSRDADVSAADTFYIEGNATGFTIVPYGTTTAIYMSSTSTVDLTTVSSSSTDTKVRWLFEKYTGNHTSGGMLTYDDGNSTLIAGNTKSIDVIVYSTRIDYSSPSLSMNSEYENRATLIWSSTYESGSIILHDEGSIRIDVSIYNGAATDYFLSGSVELDIELILDQGVYFVKNAASQTYLQSDEMCSSDNTLSAFDGANNQRWEFDHIGNGYYKITLVESGLALTASPSVGGPITLSSYSGLSAQLWTISIENGQYNIINNAYRMVASGSFAVLGAATTSNSDEWILYRHSDYLLMYIGYDVGDPLMPPLLSAVESALDENTHMDGYGFTSLNKSDLLTYLSGTKVFSCITHGLQTEILASDTELTISDIAQLDDSAFQDLELVCLTACYTGMGKEDAAYNLVNMIHSKGADTVIGFTANIDTEEANLWTQCFMEQLSKGVTVSQAMSYADTEVNKAINNGTIGVLQASTSSFYRYVAGSVDISPCD